MFVQRCLTYDVCQNDETWHTQPVAARHYFTHTHKKLIISSCDGFGRVLHFPSPWRPFARPSVDCMLSIHSTYCVVRWQRGFFLSLSLFPFLFPPPGTDEKVSRKEREFHTHTHTQSV